MPRLAAASLLGLSLALSGCGRSPAASSPTQASAESQTASQPATAAAAVGGPNSSFAQTAVTTDNGSLRASKIVGSAVYDDHAQKLGSIDDLVIGSDHSINVVLTVGGFLGFGSKKVAVPFDKLDFSNSRGAGDNRVVLPGSSKAQLSAMPGFRYTNRG